ncbi:MAG TPA: energy transducer TonB [Bacteroidales bacterium]|nr:energy transducer TonB [Bacteroidales bacterium]
MKKQRKEKDFIHLPTYPGGKEAYVEFIRKHLRYPKEALEKRIEGKVYLKYEVSDNGDVLSVEVTRSLGYGCDEEAMRLIRMLKYDKVKNRGLRLKSTIRTHIEFRLPPAAKGIQYNYTVSGNPKKEQAAEPKAPPPSFNYTIKIG